MMLYEAIECSKLERVTGLELDLKVERKCFNHLTPSSHFYDDSEELWFGDTTKSLLLLPEDC
jgi:hypothetical protein